MINIEHVSKQFGSLQVLEDISINIDQGDIFGIIGQSQPERTSVGAQGHGNDLSELQSVRPSECV